MEYLGTVETSNIDFERFCSNIDYNSFRDSSWTINKISPLFKFDILKYNTITKPTLDDYLSLLSKELADHVTRTTNLTNGRKKSNNKSTIKIEARLIIINNNDNNDTFPTIGIFVSLYNSATKKLSCSSKMILVSVNNTINNNNNNGKFLAYNMAITQGDDDVISSIGNWLSGKFDCYKSDISFSSQMVYQLMATWIERDIQRFLLTNTIPEPTKTTTSTTPIRRKKESLLINKQKTADTKKRKHVDIDDDNYRIELISEEDEEIKLQKITPLTMATPTTIRSTTELITPVTRRSSAIIENPIHTKRKKQTARRTGSTFDNKKGAPEIKDRNGNEEKIKSSKNTTTPATMTTSTTLAPTTPKTTATTTITITTPAAPTTATTTTPEATTITTKIIENTTPIKKIQTFTISTRPITRSKSAAVSIPESQSTEEESESTEEESKSTHVEYQSVVVKQPQLEECYVLIEYFEILKDPIMEGDIENSNNLPPTIVNIEPIEVEELVEQEYVEEVPVREQEEKLFGIRESIDKEFIEESVDKEFIEEPIDKEFIEESIDEEFIEELVDKELIEEPIEKEKKTDEKKKQALKSKHLELVYSFQSILTNTEGTTKVNDRSLEHIKIHLSPQSLIHIMEIINSCKGDIKEKRGLLYTTISEHFHSHFNFQLDTCALVQIGTGDALFCVNGKIKVFTDPFQILKDISEFIN